MGPPGVGVEQSSPPHRAFGLLYHCSLEQGLQPVVDPLLFGGRRRRELLDKERGRRHALARMIEQRDTLPICRDLPSYSLGRCAGVRRGLRPAPPPHAPGCGGLLLARAAGPQPAPAWAVGERHWRGVAPAPRVSQRAR